MGPEKPPFATRWLHDFFNVFGPLPYEEAIPYLGKVIAKSMSIYLEEEQGCVRYNSSKTAWEQLDLKPVKIIVRRNYTNTRVTTDVFNHPDLNRSLKRFFRGWEQIQMDT